MKKKLVLDLDAIEVTSFDTGAASVARGTVQANAASKEATCPNTIMDPSCEISCAESCLDPCTGFGFTCDMSCVEGCPSLELSCTC